MDDGKQPPNEESTIPKPPRNIKIKPKPKPKTRSVSPILALGAVAITTLLARDAPPEVMNMAYAAAAGGGAAAYSLPFTDDEYDTAISGGRVITSPATRPSADEDEFDDDVYDDDHSDSEVEEDSTPKLKKRKRVEYDETQIEGMTKWERGIFQNQLGLMKHTKRYISYQNQNSVAIDINNLFTDWRVVIQMVIGYTQSGKTGCMVELIDQMMKSNGNPISTQNIFIITGLSSRDWMKQTKSRIPECIGVNVFHNGQLENFKSAVSEKKNILVIIDEAHMASKSKQTMSRIFKDLKWKLDFMMENDIKLVQFSATPDGLIFALNGPKWPKEHFKITTMKPGDGYFGAKQMDARGQLKQMNDIYGRDNKGLWKSPQVETECIANIVQILRDHLSFVTPRYLIVRIRGGIPEKKYHENFTKAIETLSKEDQARFNNEYRSYDMSNDVEDISKLLSKPQTHHTLVFIKEKLKCAQTLEYLALDNTGQTTTHKVKHNIGVVVERRTQNDSFTIQGLLGRLCGYEEHDCICYTNLASVRKYEELFDSNFDTNKLNRVSWNSNTTHGKGEGKGTKPRSNINDEHVNGGAATSDAKTPSHIVSPHFASRAAAKEWARKHINFDHKEFKSSKKPRDVFEYDENGNRVQEEGKGTHMRDGKGSPSLIPCDTSHPEYALRPQLVGSGLRLIPMRITSGGNNKYVLLFKLEWLKTDAETDEIRKRIEDAQTK